MTNQNKRPTFLYRFSSLDDKYTLVNLKKNQLFFNHVKRLNDEDLIENLMYQDLDMLICCFAYEQNDFLWNKFGNNYNGVCVEYSVDDLLSIGDICRVKYVEDKLIFNLRKLLYQMINDKAKHSEFLKINIFRELVISKKDKFRKESEYRILLKNEDKNKIKKIKPIKIYIGHNVAKEKQKEIISICNNEIPYILV